MIIHPPRVNSSRVQVCVLCCLALLFFTGLVPVSGKAQSEADKPEGHVATSLSCDKCHVDARNGDFTFVHKEAAMDMCSECHNGMIATAQPENHLPTTANCGSCHKRPGEGWLPVTMDHSVVSLECISCHNGERVYGKPADHMTAPDTCESCHTTRAWKPARVDHSLISDSCLYCHNGSIAPGKPGDHIPAPNTCETCHTIKRWLPARMDHSQINISCVVCHNGSTAPGGPGQPYIRTDCLRGVPHNPKGGLRSRWTTALSAVPV